MPSVDDININRERLYESSSLRDDLNDEPAQILLTWGEEQVERIAQDYPDDFEKKARFLRQLIKNINRFVGQREFNEMEGQQKYMKKVTMYLPELGWDTITQDQLFASLPDDKADMMANLQAILGVLSPENDSQIPPDETSPTDANMSIEAPSIENNPDEEVAIQVQNPMDLLVNPNEDSINQDNTVNTLGESIPDDEQ